MPPTRTIKAKEAVKMEQKYSRRQSGTCEVCGQTLARRFDLKRHMILHLENQDEFKHHCPFPDCDYKTIQMSNLRTHLGIHTGEKAHMCPHQMLELDLSGELQLAPCDFRTNDPASMTRHRKRHGHKPRVYKKNGCTSTKKTVKHLSGIGRGAPSVQHETSSLEPPWVGLLSAISPPSQYPASLYSLSVSAADMLDLPNLAAVTERTRFSPNPLLPPSFIASFQEMSLGHNSHQVNSMSSMLNIPPPPFDFSMVPGQFNLNGCGASSSVLDANIVRNNFNTFAHSSCSANYPSSPSASSSYLNAESLFDLGDLTVPLSPQQNTYNWNMSPTGTSFSNPPAVNFQPIDAHNPVPGLQELPFHPFPLQEYFPADTMFRALF